MNLEQELKAALRAKSPSPDFAARVLKRLDSRERPAVRHPWRAIAAALTMTAILGGWAAREAAHRREGERAREEVLMALRITSEKLRAAQQHVQAIGLEKE